ncbi:AAA family ATPase [Lentilactobacillus sunkii]|uniref:AAA family ATPase n=1 Tax=Lentilactobacillus sunkii TaxID=481719 RepID=UPI00138F2785|nr:AAA family ATPase [Lentilactobacillus sunkii]
MDIGSKALQNVGMNDFSQLQLIDPFTFFGAFMRSGTTENRLHILRDIKDAMGLQSDMPTNFDGLPSLNPMQAWFCYPGSLVDDIDNFWNLFEDALTTDLSIEDNLNRFDKEFRTAHRLRSSKNRISFGLFWIRPDKFFSLDNNSIEYLFEFLDRDSYAKISDQIKSLKHNGSGREYLTFCENMISILNQSNLDLLGYSDQAFADRNSVRYYWLNSNPTIWDVSSKPENSAQDYTKKNEEGNPRRMASAFNAIKEGDQLIGYLSSPQMKVTTLLSCIPSSDDTRVMFRVDKQLSNPVTSDRLKNDGIVNSFYTGVKQGSLFRIRKAEYDEIIKLSKTSGNEDIDTATDFKPYTRDDFLKEVLLSGNELNQLERLLNRKKNLILQGPPGVGKSFIAKRLAKVMLNDKENPADHIKMVQFHQSYGYSNLMLGYVPDAQGFKLQYGVFYHLVQQAIKNPDENYFFLIDEINRGNVSKIFGELLMLIEADKRSPENSVTLMDGSSFYIPENIYLIGTMNTADRGLTRMDYALRRRFSFYTISPAFYSPKFEQILSEDSEAAAHQLVSGLRQLNSDIDKDETLGKDFEIGHSYVMHNGKIATLPYLQDSVVYDIIPQLEEYWQDEPDKAEKYAADLKEEVGLNER